MRRISANVLAGHSYSVHDLTVRVAMHTSEPWEVSLPSMTKSDAMPRRVMLTASIVSPDSSAVQCRAGCKGFAIQSGKVLK